MCYYTDDYCEFWRVEYPKAKKPHRCCECGELIEVGEVYERIRYIFEGDPGVDKQCRRCKFDRSRIIEYELAAGCKRHEAEPLNGELRSALYELNWEPTPKDQVPAEFIIGVEHQVGM